MDRESARQEIRRHISCTRYLEKSRSGLYCCPYCGSGTGRNHTGALKLYGTNTWTCHACGKSGDVIDLYQQETGADYNTALHQLADEIGVIVDTYQPTAAADFSDAFDEVIQRELSQATQEPPKTPADGQAANKGINPPPAAQNATEGKIEGMEQAPANYMAYYQQCRARLNDPAAQAYLSFRGISPETAAAYWIGYDPAADPASAPGGAGEIKHPVPRLIIPTSAGHYIARRTDGGQGFEKMNPKGGKPFIFNWKALTAQDVREVFITEGAFDALAIMEAGGTAAALNSTSNAETLLKLLEKKRTAATLILCLDNDEAGKKATDTLRAGLQRLNISHITADICCGSKDPNEALTTDRQAFTAAIENAIRQAGEKPDNVSYYIQNLMGEEIARFKKDIKTGYANLDEKAGGLYSGLYVLAAISSLGKTTFAHQMADQIAAAGNDVLFFSMEQSRLEMVSKSIARRTAQKDIANAVTSLAIRKGYLPQIVQDAAQEYQQATGDRLSVIEGNFACDISFIGDYIRQYMRRNRANETGNRPVIIIDYLQILQPTEDERRQTTKDTIDSAVTELKRISRELDITILVISSVNRANYLTPIDFESLKESGGIEFTADVVWGLQLQCLNDPLFDKANAIKEKRAKVKEAKAATPRKVELVCLKNRYGIANYSAYFNYYPAADLFTVCDDAELDFAAAPTTAGRRL